MSWWSWTETEIPSRTQSHWGTLGVTHLSLSFSQVPPHPSGPPVVGALQPPAFTAPLGIPPPGFAPGVPPPPPPPFLRPGFNPLHLPPGLWGGPAQALLGQSCPGLCQGALRALSALPLVGFLPPGPPPPITPPVSVPHTPAVNIPNCECWALGKAGSLQELLPGAQCVLALFLSYSHWWE